MHKLKLDPSNYVSHWYRKDTYIKAYSMFIQPVLNMKMWPASNHQPVDPPEIKAMPGRPKKNKRKSKDEPKKFGKLTRKGAQMTCSYCKGPNHNKKGCPVRKNDIAQALDDTSTPIDAVYQRKRKETGGETTSGHANMTQGSNNQPVEAASSNNPARREKLGTKKIRYGYGVFHSERNDFAVQQCGRPGGIVISPGTGTIKSSANITGDIGFEPTKVKWKGKAIKTPTPPSMKRTRSALTQSAGQ
ncbi:uncharacterized protein [Euphorbia lathyris]|uniref:uncharacterized protein n=1 Tax=Euphorbia lathyris TaxID=212925 RepID=UPI0033135A06